MLSKPLRPLFNSLLQQKQNNHLFRNTYFHFCTQKNPQNNSEQEIAKQTQDINQLSDEMKQKQQKSDNHMAIDEMDGKYIYNSKQFKDINESSFVEKLKKMEEEKKHDNTWAFDGIRFPLVLILGSLIIYHTWQTVPYGIAYRHFSHSEYIPRHGHYHAIFLGNLSFQNMGQLMVYFPVLVGSLVLSAKFLKQKHMFFLFTTNALLTYGVTYAYERSKKVSPVITPKSHGSATSLAFLSAQFALMPNLLILGSRSLPFFIIPATLYMYEIWEFQNGYINEVCRPAHFASIIYGLIFGALFKRFYYIQPMKVF